MKKAFKWIVFFVLVACGVAYMVCYAVMQEQTIAWTNKMIEVLNQPLPIAGISILTIGGVLIKILSMSSWGKKKVEELNQTIAEYKQTIEDGKTTYETYKQALQEQLDNKETEIQELKELVEQIITLNPNKKIRELIDYSKQKASEELKTKIDEIKNQVDLTLEEKIALFNEIKEQAEQLTGEYQESVLNYLKEQEDYILSEVKVD